MTLHPPAPQPTALPRAVIHARSGVVNQWWAYGSSSNGSTSV
jgi:hypothetical protein